MSIVFDKNHPGYKRFLKDTRAIARDNNIKIRITKDEFIYDAESSSKSIGYFDSEGRELASSNFNDFPVFVRNFIHETCHMDQFLYNPYLWSKCSPGYDVFFHWLETKSIYNREVIEEAMYDIIRLEKDCEFRSIAKIKKYALPIDIKDYIKRANAYLYGYLFFFEKRKWIPAVYQNPDILKHVPTRIPKEYKKIPRKLHAAFNRYLKESDIK